MQIFTWKYPAKTQRSVLCKVWIGHVFFGALFFQSAKWIKKPTLLCQGPLGRWRTSGQGKIRQSKPMSSHCSSNIEVDWSGKKKLLYISCCLEIESWKCFELMACPLRIRVWNIVLLTCSHSSVLKAIQHCPHHQAMNIPRWGQQTFKFIGTCKYTSGVCIIIWKKKQICMFSV